ncbi:hypothetical protein ZWY2020_034195 [Hordeum vulgare]|nr:hypothetical protein ZWY2020_034195 [Hordeum vulgare]
MTSGKRGSLATRCGMRVAAEVEGWRGEDDDPRKSWPHCRSCPCGQGRDPWRPVVMWSLGFGRVGLRGGKPGRSGEVEVCTPPVHDFLIKKDDNRSVGWLLGGSSTLMRAVSELPVSSTSLRLFKCDMILIHQPKYDHHVR